MKKVLVIGSGISGLSIAAMLADKYKVSVVEKDEIIGGLIKCERVDGSLFHKVGGHVFNSRNQDVLNWFWQHFDRNNEFLQARRNAKILINGILIGYPLENHLYQLPKDQLTSIIKELLDLLKEGNGETAKNDNFRDFLIGSFGHTLYQLYFGPYNTKIWNTDISKVPLEWLDGKLPMPNIKDVIISNIVKQEESAMVHASFYYPKKDGSQFILNRLAENQTINTSFRIKTISLMEDRRLLINGSLTSDAVVYTGDIRILGKIVDIDDPELKEALSSVADLLANGTSNVFCETDENDISWLYLPEEKFKAHRIIYTGNFSETNNGNTDNNRKTCVVEFSGKQDMELMLRELKLLPGNLKPIGFNYEPNSYIIQFKDTRVKVERVKRALVKYKIYLLGRFAEWEYYNMDKCIESAMELNTELCKVLGEAESEVRSCH